MCDDGVAAVFAPLLTRSQDKLLTAGQAGERTQGRPLSSRTAVTKQNPHAAKHRSHKNQKCLSQKAQNSTTFNPSKPATAVACWAQLQRSLTHNRVACSARRHQHQGSSSVNVTMRVQRALTTSCMPHPPIHIARTALSLAPAPQAGLEAEKLRHHIYSVSIYYINEIKCLHAA